MSCKLYVNIKIQGDHFSIAEKSLHRDKRKRGLAIETLKSIREVLERRMTGPDDPKRLAQLREKATQIRDKFMEKAKATSLAEWIFLGVWHKEKEVQSLYLAIDNLTAPPAILPSNTADSVAAVFRFLPAREVRMMAQVNRQGHTLAARTTVQIAQDYGYKGSTELQARQFIDQFLQGVSKLIKQGHIPKEYIVYRPNGGIDREATFRKLNDPKKEDEAALKAHLSEVLLNSAKKGDVNVLRVLLALGADPNIKDKNNGKTPLRLIPRSKPLFSLLLEHKADPNIADNNEWTPLNVYTEDPEITDLLCQHGADVNYKRTDGHTALHFTAAQNEIEAAKVLLKYGANPNIQNNQGETPLFVAVTAQKHGMVQELIKGKADPNIANNDGDTPLISNCNDEIAKLLLQQGAKIDHQNNNGETALHRAAGWWRNDILGVLLEHGANLTLTDHHGWTPLRAAGEALNFVGAIMIKMKSSHYR